jgi:hypothetical protein
MESYQIYWIGRCIMKDWAKQSSSPSLPTTSSSPISPPWSPWTSACLGKVAAPYLCSKLPHNLAPGFHCRTSPLQSSPHAASGSNPRFRSRTRDRLAVLVTVVPSPLSRDHRSLARVQRLAALAGISRRNPKQGELPLLFLLDCQIFIKWLILIHLMKGYGWIRAFRSPLNLMALGRDPPELVRTNRNSPHVSPRIKQISN